MKSCSNFTEAIIVLSTTKRIKVTFIRQPKEKWANEVTKEGDKKGGEKDCYSWMSICLLYTSC